MLDFNAQGTLLSSACLSFIAVYVELGWRDSSVERLLCLVTQDQISCFLECSRLLGLQVTLTNRSFETDSGPWWWSRLVWGAKTAFSKETRWKFLSWTRLLLYERVFHEFLGTTTLVRLEYHSLLGGWGLHRNYILKAILKTTVGVGLVLDELWAERIVATDCHLGAITGRILWEGRLEIGVSSVAVTEEIRRKCANIVNIIGFNATCITTSWIRFNKYLFIIITTLFQTKVAAITLNFALMLPVIMVYAWAAIGLYIQLVSEAVHTLLRQTLRRLLKLDWRLGLEGLRRWRVSFSIEHGKERWFGFVQGEGGV